MKTLYLLGAALSLVVLPAYAETMMGEVIAVEGNLVSVQTPEGQKMTFQTNDNTTYRKKAMQKRHKKKRGTRSSAEWIYQPIAEEDDWVEVTYNPKSGNESIYEVDAITLYDD